MLKWRNGRKYVGYVSIAFHYEFSYDKQEGQIIKVKVTFKVVSKNVIFTKVETKVEK